MSLTALVLEKATAPPPFVHPLKGVTEWTRLRAARKAELPDVLVNTGGATARRASEHGLSVTMALDAMTDVLKEAHNHTRREAFARLDEMASAQEIASMLEQRSAKA